VSVSAVSSAHACPYASGMSSQPSQPTGSAPTVPSPWMPSRAVVVVIVSLMVSPLGLVRGCPSPPRWRPEGNRVRHVPP
jgi:hypothetical protein